MELTNTHIRYILEIYKLGQAGEQVSSSDIAKNLMVRKASVSRMLLVLIEKQLVTKQLYGKVNLTETGACVAKEYTMRIQQVEEQLARLDIVLTKKELRDASCALMQVLPEKCFEDWSKCRKRLHTAQQTEELAESNIYSVHKPAHQRTPRDSDA